MRRKLLLDTREVRARPTDRLRASRPWPAASSAASTSVLSRALVCARQTGPDSQLAVKHRDWRITVMKTSFQQVCQEPAISAVLPQHAVRSHDEKR